MHDGIGAIMEQRSLFKEEMKKIRKPKAPKLDAKFRNRIANHLVSDQMGQEPTAAQVAYKAAELINEIVSSDQKNIFALTNILERQSQIYRGGK